MIVANNTRNYIEGNTVLVPDFETPYKEHKKSRTEKKQKDLEKARKHKKTQIRNVTIAFIFGITIIGRYSIIYNTQNSVANMENSIKELSDENGRLNVIIAENSNINNIEIYAKDNLNMINENEGPLVYSDLSKYYFKDTVKVEMENTKVSLFGKIKALLF
ncbi:MAG: septum formation initiator family protein [Clostridiaceae bacterium]